VSSDRVGRTLASCETDFDRTAKDAYGWQKCQNEREGRGKGEGGMLTAKTTCSEPFAGGIDFSHCWDTLKIMSTVEEITEAVAVLPERDFWLVTDRILEMRESHWDQQMIDDARSGGPLDRIAQAALIEFKQGRTKPLR
jgi:hypothetical protein